MEGLSGCPSVFEIASALGVDLNKEFNKGGAAVVPVVVGASEGEDKFKDEVYEQVVEMARRDINVAGGDHHHEDGDELLMQQTPFTSLLMLPSHVDTWENDYGSEEAGDLLWNCDPAYQVCDEGGTDVSHLYKFQEIND